jgi:hypothetical protein
MMRSTPLKWGIAALASISAGLAVAAPIASWAITPSHPAARPASAHPVGFFVTDGGQVTKGTATAALVRDRDGGEHVVTVKQDLAVSGDRGHVVYLTRTHKARLWTRTVVPGLRPLGGIRLETHISYSGAHIFAVLHQCNGVYVTEATLRSNRLPTPTLVQSADTCASPASPPAASAPPISAATAPYIGEVSVLLDDPAHGNQPALFMGPAGGPFNPEEAIPVADGFIPRQLAIDSRHGELVVVGTGMSGGDQAIYETSAAYYGDPWKPLRKIASLGSPTTDYTIESVAVGGRNQTGRDGTVWVGLQKPRHPGSPKGHTLYLAQSASNGQWFGAAPFPNTTSLDTALVLATNPRTGTLHAAFTRVDPTSPTKNSGIMVEACPKGDCQAPHFLTHWAHDYAQDLTLTSKGHEIVGYAQR